jgi:hypothetical protein
LHSAAGHIIKMHLPELGRQLVVDSGELL